MRIFVINPGATSTKIAIFEEETAVFSKTITHDADALAPFSQVLDQVEYRLADPPGVRGERLLLAGS